MAPDLLWIVQGSQFMKKKSYEISRCKKHLGKFVFTDFYSIKISSRNIKIKRKCDFYFFWIEIGWELANFLSLKIFLKSKSSVLIWTKWTAHMSR